MRHMHPCIRIHHFVATTLSLIWWGGWGGVWRGIGEPISLPHVPAPCTSPLQIWLNSPPPPSLPSKIYQLLLHALITSLIYPVRNLLWK